MGPCLERLLCLLGLVELSDVLKTKLEVTVARPLQRRTARHFNLTYKYFRTLDSGNDTEFPRNSMSDTLFFSAC